MNELLSLDRKTQKQATDGEKPADDSNESSDATKDDGENGNG